MRLSATERIIRQAEEDAAQSRPADRNRRSLLPLEMPGSRALFRTPRPETAAVDIDIVIDVDPTGDDHEGHDDEGQTLVDVEKSAAALHKLRSYGGVAAAAVTPQAEAQAARESLHPLSPLRPASKMVGNSVTSAQAFPWSEASPRKGAGLPPGRPLLPGMPTHVVQSQPVLPEPLLVGVPVPSEVTSSLRPRHVVGRRLGWLIAAATAAVVALAVGTWTGDSRPGAAGGRPATLPSSRPLQVNPVIVPTGPSSLSNTTKDATAGEPSAPQPPARGPDGSPALIVDPVPARFAAARHDPTSSADKNTAHVSKKKTGKSRQPRSTGHRSAMTARARTQAPAKIAPVPAPVRSARVAGRPLADPDATLPFAE